MKNKQKKILVVDDEDGPRRNIEKALERAGYDIETANGIDATLQLLKAHSFDLAILDLRMPDWTGKLSKTAGIQLLVQMREKGYIVPVIMLTATNDAMLATEAIVDHGADNYLVKGEISQRDMINVIENTLEKHRAV